MLFKIILSLIFLVGCGSEAPRDLFPNQLIKHAAPKVFGEPDLQLDWQQELGIFHVFDARTRSIQRFSSNNEQFYLQHHVPLPDTSEERSWKLISKAGHHLMATRNEIYLFQDTELGSQRKWVADFEIEKFGFAEDISMIVIKGDSGRRLWLIQLDEDFEISGEKKFRLDEILGEGMKRLRSPQLFSNGMLIGLAQNEQILSFDLEHVFANESVSFHSEVPIEEASFSELIKVSNTDASRLAIAYDTSSAMLLDLESYEVIDTMVTWSGAYMTSLLGNPHLIVRATESCTEDCMIQIIWADIEQRQLVKRTLSVNARNLRETWLTPETSRLVGVRGANRQINASDDRLSFSRVEVYNVDSGVLEVASEHPYNTTFSFGASSFLALSPSLLGELRVFRLEDSFQVQKLSAFNRQWLQSRYASR